ncbi:MAG TPA: hypothetical protein VGH02_13990 [Rhizomicrobium sp.]
MEENQAHAGNGPADPSSPPGRTIEEVMEQDIVPATTMLREALRSCAGLIGDVSRVARNPDETARAQTDSALAAARLGSTTAQLMSALARAADSDTRVRIANMRIEEAQARRNNAVYRHNAHNRRAREEREYRPVRNHDEDGLYNPDLNDDY